MKTTLKPIHCAWCGRDFPPTKKDRPKQHKDGVSTCLGAGQVRRVHDARNKVREAKANEGRN